MGQHAALVHINRNGNARMTTIQWSTGLDRSFSNAFGTTKDQAKRKNDVREFFTTITNTYEHVESIESDTTYNFSTATPVNNTTLVVHEGRERINKKASIRKATVGGDNLDAHYTNIVDGYLDGSSVGAIYDERHPDVITFTWLNIDDMPDFEAVDIDDFMEDGYCLGFYEAVEDRNNLLRELSATR